MNTNTTHLQARAKALRLAGLLAHWDSLAATPTQLAWVVRLLDCEEQLRGQRSLERRMRAAHLQPFKPLADFDWSWPTRCDRETVQDLMGLAFMADATNVMLVGTNGLGVQSGAPGLGAGPYRAVHQCDRYAGRVDSA